VDRRPASRRALATAVLEHRGRLLIDRRSDGGLLAGLWDLPAVELEPGQTDAARAGRRLTRHLARAYGVTVAVTAVMPAIEHALTHLRLTLYPFRCRLVRRTPRSAESRSWRWVPVGQLEQYAMPRAARRVLARD
jgi:A/G-specific adenine glycosylase